MLWKVYTLNAKTLVMATAVNHCPQHPSIIKNHHGDSEKEILGLRGLVSFVLHPGLEELGFERLY